MFRLNRTYKWPYKEPEKDYPPYFNIREDRAVRNSTDMSLPGRRYTYRPYSGQEDEVMPYSSFSETYTGPPPNARNVRSYTLRDRPGVKGQEPIWIVPPKKEPRYITMEVKEPDPEPIMVLPPPPPKKRVIEYEVPIKQKPPEPILVPVLPPPKEPEYMTVRHVVEEGAPNGMPLPLPGPAPYLSPPPPAVGPKISRLPDNYERRGTLLGVRRTLLWELVLASFILFLIMLLIAIFLAGFLSQQ